MPDPALGVLPPALVTVTLCRAKAACSVACCARAADACGAAVLWCNGAGDARLPAAATPPSGSGNDRKVKADRSAVLGVPGMLAAAASRADGRRDSDIDGRTLGAGEMPKISAALAASGSVRLRPESASPCWLAVEPRADDEVDDVLSPTTDDPLKGRTARGSALGSLTLRRDSHGRLPMPSVTPPLLDADGDACAPAAALCAGVGSAGSGA